MTTTEHSPDVFASDFVTEVAVPAPAAVKLDSVNCGGYTVPLSVSYPDRDTAVLSVHGEVDAATITDLRELLWLRLNSALHRVIVDLSGVEFLGVCGLELLNQADQYALVVGKSLRLVGTQYAVTHPLKRAGMNRLLPAHATSTEALSAETP